MAAKEFLFRDEAREALRHGVETVANAVSVTLGPRGRTVVLDKKFGPPLIVDDGVTIAREIELEDHFENMGAELLKEIAIKTNDVAGDGTTTATILGRSMINGGILNLTAGASPVELKAGINAATEAVVEAVRALARPVKGREDIERIATISASDEGIGKMVADAIDRVGPDGVVTVKDSDGIDTEVEVVDGMQFDRGYISPYLATDQKTMEAVLEKPLILLTDGKISNVTELVPVLEIVMAQKRPLLIVAEDVSGEALATLIVNRVRGTFTAVAVKAPGFGERREAMMQDLAILTGATVISEKIGLDLKKVRLDQLGTAKTTTSTKDNTTVLEGAGSEGDVKARCDDIRRQIEDTTSDWDREKLQERLARLAGGVAVIKNGAATEVEMKERKARIEDALAATRAAIEDGVVPGGGVALIRAAAAVDKVKLEGDAATGVRIVRRCLDAPLRILGENCGLEPGVVVEKVAGGTGNFGLNGETGEFGDLIEFGVIDPAKVVIAAITNAASIANMLLSTDALIADVPEEEPAGAAHDHDHGGGMGDMMGGMGGMGGMGDMGF
jgi:chaperonin GroEL